MERIDVLIARLRNTDDDDVRDEIKSEMVTIAMNGSKSEVCEYIESAMKEELLEVQWELEEVLETLVPPKAAPAPEPEPVDDPSTRQLRSTDVELVYDDPRGLRLYKSKVDERWVVSQIDPRLGQYVSQEVSGFEMESIKPQLLGSPYWLKQV